MAFQSMVTLLHQTTPLLLFAGDRQRTVTQMCSKQQEMVFNNKVEGNREAGANEIYKEDKQSLRKVSLVVRKVSRGVGPGGGFFNRAVGRLYTHI